MSSLLAFWRRRMTDLSGLSLWKVLHARGTREIANQQPQKLELAFERCLGCADAVRCGKLLDEGNYSALEGFCPNVMYFRHLDAMKRHAAKPSLTEPDA